MHLSFQKRPPKVGWPFKSCCASRKDYSNKRVCNGHDGNYDHEVGRWRGFKDRREYVSREIGRRKYIVTWSITNLKLLRSSFIAVLTSTTSYLVQNIITRIVDSSCNQTSFPHGTHLWFQYTAMQSSCSKLHVSAFVTFGLLLGKTVGPRTHSAMFISCRSLPNRTLRHFMGWRGIWR